MSVIVTTAKPGNIHQAGEINWTDYGFSKFRTVIKLDAAATIADLTSIAGLADVISNAHVCDLVLAGQGYNAAGQDAAVAAELAKSYEVLKLTFKSRANCEAEEIVQIPAPLPGASGALGVSGNIWADPLTQRDLNLSNADVVALAAAITPVLASDKYSITDWQLVDGERVTFAVNYRGQRKS
jgi:hypothetical protein